MVQGGGEGALCGLSYRGTDPTYEGSSLMTQSPPIGPLNTITMGVSFPHMNVGLRTYTLGL